MPGRVWTCEKLILEIRRLNEESVDLSPTSIQKTHGALFSSARSRSHFGNWRAAIEASGLDYNDIKRVKQRWSHGSIVKQICAHHANGEDLLHPAFKAQHRNLYLAACAHRYFGSWRRALMAAGLDHEKMRESRVWTKARIQRTIEELAAQGESLSWSSVEQRCPGIYRAARRRENFGSWHRALTAAGVVTNARRRGRRPNALKVNGEKSVDEKTLNETVNQLTRVHDNAFDTPVLPKLYGVENEFVASELSSPEKTKR